MMRHNQQYQLHDLVLRTKIYTNRVYHIQDMVLWMDIPNPVLPISLPDLSLLPPCDRTHNSCTLSYSADTIRDRGVLE